MFGFSKSQLSKSDIHQLNEIDREYMRAFSTKTIDGLRGSLAPACLEKVGWVVHSFNDRYFADEKFRHTEWEVINVSGNFYTLKKQVVFDKIRINAMMSISAANNYTEQWVICKKDKVVVMDIEAWKK